VGPTRKGVKEDGGRRKEYTPDFGLLLEEEKTFSEKEDRLLGSYHGIWHSTLNDTNGNS